MRRQQSSIVITGLVFVVASLLYLLVPNDPVSASFQRLVFGLDNRFSSGSVENTADQALVRQIDELTAENQRLQSELKLRLPNDDNFIGARIVSKSVQNYRSTIDVAVGSRDGVQHGDSVLAAGQLIGRVIEVSENRSRVLTIFDPDFRAAVIVEGSNFEGLVRHVPGGAILEQVPGTIPKRFKEARVVTSGLGGLYPPGLMLGTLGDDVSTENAIFKEYILNTPTNIGALREVVIVL